MCLEQGDVAVSGNSLGTEIWESNSPGKMKPLLLASLGPSDSFETGNPLGFGREMCAEGSMCTCVIESHLSSTRG